MSTQSIEFAIEIFANVNDAWADNTAYGLKNSAFRFVSGRPGFSSFGAIPIYGPHEIDIDGNNISNTNATPYWYEGFLTKEFMGSNPSKSIDIVSNGSYSSDCSFSFNIRNDILFWNFCIENGIEFTGRKCVAWAIIDNVFYKIMQGIISNNPYDDQNYTFNVSDGSSVLHKQLPPTILTTTEYKDVSDQSDGDVIPVVFGDVPYSKALKTVSQESLVQLSNGPVYLSTWTPNTSINVFVAAAMNYTSTYQNLPYSQYKTNNILLITYGISFVKNDPRLVGKYLTVISGKNYGKNYYKITGNGATGSVATFETQIVFSDPLLYEDGSIVNMDDFNSSSANDIKLSFYCTPQENGYGGVPVKGSIDTWWFTVSDLNTAVLISNQNTFTLQPIDNLTKNINRYAAYTYNSDLKQYDDIHDLVDINSTSSSIKLTCNLTTTDKKIPVYKDLGFKLTSFGAWNDTNIFDASGTASNKGQLVTDPIWIESVTDGKRELDQFSFPLNINSSDSVYLFATFTLAELKELPDNIKFLFDISMLNGASGLKVQFGEFTWYAYDIYGTQLFASTSTLSPNVTPKSWDVSISTLTNFNLLPNNYYTDSNIGTDNVSYYNVSGMADGATGTIKTVNSFFDFEDHSQDKDNLQNLDRISYIVCKVRIKKDTGSISSLDLRVKQIALIAVTEKETLNGDIYLKVKGELTGPSATDPNHETNDVYHTFMHILEDYDGINKNLIDYGDLATTRNLWHIGRTLTDRMNSIEYLNELCAQTFVGMFTTRTGKIALRAFQNFDSTETSTVYHNNDNIINGSISGFEKTDISSTYNNFKLQYNFDPGLDKFTKSLFISQTDTLTSFPLISDDSWKKYAGGLSGNGAYSHCKEIWDICRASFLVSGSNRQAQNDLSQLYWFIDRALFDSSTTWGTNLTSSAYYFLQLLSQWATIQKYIVSYSIPITANNIELEILDLVYFSDKIYTNNVNKIGRIIGIEYDTSGDVMNLQTLIYPDTMQSFDNLIIEGDHQLNTITEGNHQTDTITEG